MEKHARGEEDKENIDPGKGNGANVPGKRLGLKVRGAGALGDVNTNLQIPREAGTNSGKVDNAATTLQKKASLKGAIRRRYSHVQSKIDTGLACTQVASKTPLQHEKSTAFMALTAPQNKIQDKENIDPGKGKGAKVLPGKPLGLKVRGALGDVNTNLQIPREAGTNSGKVDNAATALQKKASLKGAIRRSYSHVQSKIDTGLSCTQVASKTPLQHEKCTAFMGRTAPQNKALKDITNEVLKSTTSSTSSLIVTKTTNQKNKKILKGPTVKEYIHKEKALHENRQIQKDHNESLGQVKLGDDIKQRMSDKIVNLISPKVHLPHDIEDIDAGDMNNPFLVATYTKDIYKYLLELELKDPIKEDHLKIQSVITASIRATLIEKLMEVQRKFALVPETFQLTVQIIDRYLQVVPDVQLDRIRLIGVTAIFIASKFEDVYAPDVGRFVYLTDNTYSKADLFKCEREILSKVGFCLTKPIPLDFLRRFVKAAHGKSRHYHLAKCLVNLCLVEYTVCHYRPSELAAASLCLSLHLLSNKPLHEVWTPTLAYYSQYTLTHIKPIIKKVAEVFSSVETSKLKSVYKICISCKQFCKVAFL